MIHFTSGLYYKHITVVNYDSSVVNKCVASLSDDARVIIYDRHVFVVQATAVQLTVFSSQDIIGIFLLSRSFQNVSYIKLMHAELCICSNAA
jgi:hypothetical protein